MSSEPFLKICDFASRTQSVGRNGPIISTGVSVYSSQPFEAVDLIPITSRGALGNCRVSVPVKSLPVLIGILQELQDQALPPDSMRCLDCKDVDVLFVGACEPDSTDHWQCPVYDGTYALEDFPKGKEQSC